jgi:hypothetical protein
VQRINLPDGQWVDIRSQEEITTRGRRAITAVASGLGTALPKLAGVDPHADIGTLGLTEVEVDVVMRMQEATVAAFLAAWSFPEPLPTAATMGDIPAALYDLLSDVTAESGAGVANLTLDTGAGDGTPDPKGPSGASKNSGGRSKAVKVPVPTPI